MYGGGEYTDPYAEGAAWPPAEVSYPTRGDNEPYPDQGYGYADGSAVSEPPAPPSGPIFEAYDEAPAPPQGQPAPSAWPEQHNYHAQQPQPIIHNQGYDASYEHSSQPPMHRDRFKPLPVLQAHEGGSYHNDTPPQPVYTKPQPIPRQPQTWPYDAEVRHPPQGAAPAWPEHDSAHEYAEYHQTEPPARDQHQWSNDGPQQPQHQRPAPQRRYAGPNTSGSGRGGGGGGGPPSILEPEAPRRPPALYPPADAAQQWREPPPQAGPGYHRAGFGSEDPEPRGREPPPPSPLKRVAKPIPLLRKPVPVPVPLPESAGGRCHSATRPPAPPARIPPSEDDSASAHSTPNSTFAPPPSAINGRLPPRNAYAVRKPPQDMEKDDWAFFCEPCDKGFYTQARYLEHCEEHIYCPVPGCKFLCRKLYKLELHKMLLHDRNNINLEDTEKYVAERRRKFPTRERIAQARALEDLKRQRGQELEKALGIDKGAKPARRRHIEHKARPPLYYKCRVCGRAGHYTEHCWQAENAENKSRSPSFEPPVEADAREPPPELPAASGIKADGSAADPPMVAPTMRDLKQKLREERHLRALLSKRKRKQSFWEKLTKSEVSREQSLVLQCFRYFCLTDFLQKDIDWVAFVSHQLKEDLVTPDESAPCAVRTVTRPPKRKDTDANTGAGSNKRQRTRAASADSGSEQKSSSDDDDDDDDERLSKAGAGSGAGGDNPKPVVDPAEARIILSELEEAKRRIAELEKKLLGL
ncbi:zinc finger protein [Diplonema papillatum]|nr:zinc finger protein [Diplonema papillatum]